MATENFHSAIDDSKFKGLDLEEAKENHVETPAKTATIEDDWIKLRTQN